ASRRLFRFLPPRPGDRGPPRASLPWRRRPLTSRGWSGISGSLHLPHRGFALLWGCFRTPRPEEGALMWRIAWILALWGLVGSPLSADAQGAKDTLSVDLPGEPASLDPHVQWDTDSYHVYRNIFDNLVTRSPDGKIVPQIAKAWRYENDTTLVLDIRTHLNSH